jgi:hypothetical protein
MAPPPKKRRVGLILGIAGGALALVVAVVVGLALIGTQLDKSAPAGTATLTVPKTLADGRYRLTKDLSDTEGAKIKKSAGGTRDDRITDAVVGRYDESGDSLGGLVISGAYGRFRDVDAMRHGMLSGARQGQGVSEVIPPKDFVRTGSPVVSCEVLTREQGGASVTYPVCGWADAGTAAVIVVMNSKSVGQNPYDLDLGSYAELTRKVRSETVKPAG